MPPSSQAQPTNNYSENRRHWPHTQLLASVSTTMLVSFSLQASTSAALETDVVLRGAFCL